jgi:hypothetical protein
VKLAGPRMFMYVMNPTTAACTSPFRFSLFVFSE